MGNSPTHKYSGLKSPKKSSQSFESEAKALNSLWEASENCCQFRIPEHPRIRIRSILQNSNNDIIVFGGTSIINMYKLSNQYLVDNTKYEVLSENNILFERRLSVISKEVAIVDNSFQGSTCLEIHPNIYMFFGGYGLFSEHILVYNNENDNNKWIKYNIKKDCLLAHNNICDTNNNKLEITFGGNVKVSLMGALNNYILIIGGYDHENLLNIYDIKKNKILYTSLIKLDDKFIDFGLVRVSDYKFLVINYKHTYELVVSMKGNIISFSLSDTNKNSLRDFVQKLENEKAKNSTKEKIKNKIMKHKHKGFRILNCLNIKSIKSKRNILVVFTTQKIFFYDINANKWHATYYIFPEKVRYVVSCLNKLTNDIHIICDTVDRQLYLVFNYVQILSTMKRKESFRRSISKGNNHNNYSDTNSIVGQRLLEVDNESSSKLNGSSSKLKKSIAKRLIDSSNNVPQTEQVLENVLNDFNSGIDIEPLQDLNLIDKDISNKSEQHSHSVEHMFLEQ